MLFASFLFTPLGASQLSLKLHPSTPSPSRPRRTHKPSPQQPNNTDVKEPLQNTGQCHPRIPSHLIPSRPHDLTPTMTFQTIAISSIPFHTLLEGPPTGPLIVLSHALMANHHMWDSTVLSLHSLGYRTLRYDHIGHNLTGLPTNSQTAFTFDDFTHHIHALISTLCPKQTPHAIIGCSMGGVLAVRYAMLYPIPPVPFIISCDAPGMTSLSASKPKWRERIAQFKREGVGNLATATVERWFPEPCTDEARTEGLAMTRTCSVEGYGSCAEGIMGYDYTDDLAAIDPEKTQVMVLVGENDEAVGPREVLEDVAKRIRGSVFVRMEGVGHLPPVHGKGEFERIVGGFLGRVS